MTDAAASIRVLGNSVRASLLNVHLKDGPVIGYALARRYVEEAAAVLAEVHGRKASFDVLQRTCDDLIGDELFSDIVAETTPEIVEALGWREDPPPEPVPLPPVETPATAPPVDWWGVARFYATLGFGALLGLAYNG